MGKLPRRAPRSLPALREKLAALHLTLASVDARTARARLFPDTARVRRTASSRSAACCRDRARGRVRDAARRLLRGRRSARRRARTARRRPDALVVYGTKAFPNVALLRLLAEEGVGADVSTLGELAFAQAAGIAGERLVVHGNNKSDEELRGRGRGGRARRARRAERGRARARAAGVRARARARHAGRRGRHARGDPDRRTTARSSACRPTRRSSAIADARAPGSTSQGSTSTSARSSRDSTRALLDRRLARRVLRARRDELGWTPAVLDLGGGLGDPLHRASEPAPSRSREFVGRSSRGSRERLARTPSQLDPRAGPLARRPRGRDALPRRRREASSGGVDATSPSTAACPTTRARSSTARATTALLANRADEPPTGVFAVAGKHCESGDVLIERGRAAEPRRGDLLAVPATGAYTLAMGSTTTRVPRPAAVLVARRRGAR